MQDARELPITGYLDRFSHRPGETFLAHVSVPGGGACTARLLRVISADPNPAGPGVQLEDLSAVFRTGFTGRHQPIALGSYAHIDRGPPHTGGARSWTALVWSAMPADVPRTIIAEYGDGAAVLGIGPTGAEFEITGSSGPAKCAVGQPLPLRRWTRIWASVDPATGETVVGQMPLDSNTPALARLTVPAPAIPSGTVMIAARDPAAPTAHLTGRIEDPAILGGFGDTVPAPLATPDSFGESLLALWDFSQGIDTQTVRDVGPHACHGRLVNLPTRAVCGARWSGGEMCWRHAPRDYAAIHFHAGDLSDCHWQSDFSFTVPADLPSGVYALHLRCDAGEDWLPLYVLPPRGRPSAPVLFLASTFTYQAYANHARGNADDAYCARVAKWGAYPHNPDFFPIYGRSTYNRHEDNAGVAFSSRLRPVLTMRPGFLTFNDTNGSGLRHFPADTHLLGWLEAKGIAFDVVTDEDLDDEGVALLEDYRVVLTGSHPEYHTAGTLDALRDYTRRGGRLAYLGGNGFYWRIARNKDVPGVIEVRRAEGGIRAWAAEPGEYFHAFDGQYGGLWRRNRRPPQALVGVGFSAQGLFEGVGYHRMPASFDPQHAWIFAGIENTLFGDYGLSGGGAAGFELDRADTALGTPEDAAILARSERPTPSFIVVPEELLSHIATVTGEPPPALLRAEIVFLRQPDGGAIFSVGSITFCGSLWKNGWSGDVSRLLENVLRRFSDPAPL